jgi:uncharacterized membrane protein
MDSVHLHLILNHLPMVGILVAIGIFLLGWLRGTVEFQRLALGLLICFGLATIPVYLTGGAAEHAVKRLPEVSKALIEAHETAAGAAFVAVEVLAGFSLLGFVLFRESAAIAKSFTAGLLVLALSTTGLFAWTGYLGGQIRHPEIRAGSSIGNAFHAAVRADTKESDN